MKIPPRCVNGRAGASAEKEKGPSCTWGSRVNSECFTLIYPSFMAIVVPQAGASHVLHFWTVKVNMFLFCFIFMHGSGSFISPRADSESRLHMPALRINGSNPATSVSGHRVSSRDLPKSLQMYTSPGKLNPNTLLVNPSWINSCLSLLPLFEKCVQISTFSDMLIIQNYFQIGLQNITQVQSL